MKQAELEILIATMNRTELSFLYDMFKDTGHEGFHILIVNQTSEDRLLKSPYGHIRVINSFEKGLSKSRNLAIQHAVGDICLIADDDTCFIRGFDTIIKQAFAKYGAALIAFQIETFEGVPYKKYRKTPSALVKEDHLEALSSVEMAFKRADICHNNIIFNELFGLNAYFEMGEEFLFARDVLRSGLGVHYVPEKIVKHSKISSTSDYGHDRVLYARGALSAVKHGKIAVLWLLKFVFFLARKGFIRWREVSAKLRMGLKGMRYYRRWNNAEL